MRGKFHFFEHNQERLDQFIDIVYSKILTFQPEESPHILNRGLRKEDSSDDNSGYFKSLVDQRNKSKQR